MVEKYFQKHTIELMDSTHHCTKGLKTVRAIFKEYLALLHTPFYDDLDPLTTLVPIRYDSSTDEIQRYDPVTKTWIVIIGGGGGTSLIAYRYTAVTDNFLITDRVLEVGAAVTITMAFVPVVGIEYNIKNSSGGVVTVIGGVYNIDGSPIHTIPSGEARTFFYNGTQFIII